MNGLSTKYGGDGPEAQLIALQQVALRADTEIGFRDGAQRFVVLSTDAAFHQAGNYLAGGTNDNDSDLADGTGAFGLEDYPAIAQVAAALAAADPTPIFAVTSGLTATYQNLLNVMNSVDPTIGGSVVTLSSDSSNLGSAIIAGLSEATTNVDIAVVGDDYGFITSVTPSSYTSVQGPDTVTFDVTMEEPASYGNDTVTLQVPNFGEVVLNFDFGTEDLVGTAGRDTLTGNNYANTISGLERADTISGMGGDDILIGGLGDDLLSGGLGNDTFVFENAVNFRGTDTVTDFVKGSDILQLSGYGAVAFGDLGLSDDGAGNAEVMVNDGAADDPIIVLLGVDFNTLDASDFTFV
jgi:Ca2+-binding RTX toxin-like protein